MKIDTRILVTRANKYVWEDDNPSGHGFVVYPVGAEVSDAWLEENGLVDADEPEPKAPAKPTTKQAAPAANKAVKSPSADK